MNNLINKLKTFFLSIRKSVWAVIVFAFVFGLWISGPEQTLTVHDDHNSKTQVEFWTCSMHPQVKLTSPGQCPICFMDLIPLEISGTDSPIELKMSENAMAIAGIITAPVRRGIARKDIRLSGKVDYDETRMKHITAWFPGRLEHLFVDYTGITVQKGDHMVEIYSPSLYAAQEEFLQALALAQKQTSQNNIAGRSGEALVESAREKLRLLGLTLDQVLKIEKRGTPSDLMEIFSPLSGVVINKNAVEGMYVKTGSRIYTVADLSRVWIILDAYESDLSWLAYGQEVSLKVEALPGEMFTGRVSFIDPVLDPKTRTVKVRINISNSAGKLKPNMFVSATVHSQVDAQGNVVNTFMAGKWVGSMHPEIVKDAPGKCDICGMPLIKAEDMGIVSGSINSGNPLLIPASSVLLTGKRAVVYVMLPDRDEPTFESREIIVGARTGNDYIVVSGLKKGELVVKKGNFKIDSAMQIAAKPSMMNPEGGVSMSGHAGHGDMETSAKTAKKTETPAAAQKEMSVNDDLSLVLRQIYNSYFKAQAALAGDNLKSAKESLLNLKNTLTDNEETKHALSADVKSAWQKQRETLLMNLEHLQHWTSLDAVRKGFDVFSASIIKLEKTFGHDGDQNYYEILCPMAFNNKGAYWLQTSKKVNNPYFGEKMIGCGVIKSESKPRTVISLEGGL